MHINKSLCRHNELKQICKWYSDGNCILNITDNVAPCEKVIVRCKDCKHATFYSCKNDACYQSIICEYGIGIGDENFFCACGERR